MRPPGYHKCHTSVSRTASVGLYGNHDTWEFHFLLAAGMRTPEERLTLSGNSVLTQIRIKGDSKESAQAAGEGSSRKG